MSEASPKSKEQISLARALRTIGIPVFLAGAAAGYLGYQNQTRMETIYTEAVVTDAQITSELEEARTFGRFQIGAPYKIDIAWEDLDGGKRTMQDMGIYPETAIEFYDEFNQRNFLNILSIAYVPEKPEIEPVPAGSLPDQARRARRSFYLGLAGLVFGLVLIASSLFVRVQKDFRL